MSLVFRCLQRLEEGVRTIGNGITDNCELPNMCAKMISGPLKEQKALLTIDSSLQILIYIFIFFSILEYRLLRCKTQSFITIYTKEVQNQVMIILNKRILIFKKCPSDTHNLSKEKDNNTKPS